ncbi:MAG: four-carbon acid sugar kinase family protein [Hyphomicrobiaceae bacterium]
MAAVLGAIADDLTGATDLANTLVKRGMRTVQVIGVPDTAAPAPDADAIVVALKSRTIAAAEAIAQSRQALAWLRQADIRQTIFKYCSTFDSTDTGNIGPVADALLADLGSSFTIACPAFPENKRTIYQGHLFVGDQLLSESSMRHHPLTPMTDANLVRVLQRQTDGKVGLIPYATVNDGARAVWTAIKDLMDSGHRYAITDAIRDRHLIDIGEAVAGLPLVTGGSGIALGLPRNFQRLHSLQLQTEPPPLPDIVGLSAIVSGSCSQATLGQVAAWANRYPAHAIDPLALAKGVDAAAIALAWARKHLADGPVLIYASAPPDDVKRVQAEIGREQAGQLVEEALAKVAKGLVEAGVRRLIVAGGETSGAVVQELGVSQLRIGPEIDPGVPWTESIGAPRLALALKSGNFGAPDFFAKALGLLP